MVIEVVVGLFKGSTHSSNNIVDDICHVEMGGGSNLDLNNSYKGTGIATTLLFL